MAKKKKVMKTNLSSFFNTLNIFKKILAKQFELHFEKLSNVIVIRQGFYFGLV
jgi:hypothetical protein